MLISSNPDDIASILREGGVVAYPTEAVWGLGCDPYNEAAVHKILALKSRPIEKGLILITGHPTHLEPWKECLSNDAFERLISITETPTSWVVPDVKIAPFWVRGEHQSVAIRLSQHTPVANLCRSYGGAIVSTSANPAGLEPAKTKEEVIAYFSDQCDAIFDQNIGTASKPSQVLDILTGTKFRA
ncbi:L-threonylcarbamoyladenylate synthase [Marinomonas ostreistagni]|uniref:Threonylcarbamoyl-AMP synthase n=1 Tax=Marinomonas ostreistagni TaxID=359209 RepID=A0ABS0ZCN5_9GAMM|nr:Sua5/YciO/YrdC/YwlC family protein [Marinomonas ostreistagni]MBJ7551427.1 Sua5/YciO/YrdC/YwlC family protein [Marinomonas ostreistagni]